MLKLKTDTLLDTVKKIAVSRKFVLFVLIMVILQGLVYAGTVRFAAPPDEAYHFNTINYFAEQPLTDGPFLDKQDPSTISSIRSIDRVASYFYHYVLSFPVRLMTGLNLSMGYQVLLLRIVNIAMVAWSLVILKKVLEEISSNKALINLSVAAVAMTGMFVWLAGAINYDNAANLLFFTFILLIVRHIKKPNLTRLAWVGGLGMAIVLTKYSFAPMSGIGVMASIFVLVRAYGFKFNAYKKATLRELSRHRVLTILALTFLVLMSVLFIERIGVNIVSYGAVQPKCYQFHTVEQCSTHNLYRGHLERHQLYLEQGGRDELNLNLVSHTGEWINRYYNRLYGYFGHERFGNNVVSEAVAIIVGLFVLFTSFLSRRKIRLKPEAWFLMGITVFYIISLYLFNLNTYLNLGARTAYHGRYLIPVLGLIYFFIGSIILNTSKNMNEGSRRYFLASWILVITIAVATHFPPILLYVNSNEDWYSPSFKSLNILPKINPAHKEVIR